MDRPPPPPPSSSPLGQCAASSVPVVVTVPVPIPVALPVTVTSNRASASAEDDTGTSTCTSLEPAAVTPPSSSSSSSSSSHHGVTATGVLATTTTALVHNRLTHAAGGMLSSTLTGLFTLLLVLFVYRKSFLLPFGGSSSSRNLSLTEYNTEYNRHVGASGTASGKARPQSSGSASAGDADGAASGNGPQPVRGPRSPPPPTRYPGGPTGPKPTLRIKLDQDQVVDEEGEVYRCIIKSPLPEGSLKPCLRRAATPIPTAEEGEARPPLLLEPSSGFIPAPSSPTLSNDGHESSTSSTSSSTSKKTVRLIEPAHSAFELDRLRSHWASCATSPACKGIGGYRSTRDIYAKGQGGDRTTASVTSPPSNSGAYLHPHPHPAVPSPGGFGVDEQNNSLGLDVSPLPSSSSSSSGSTPLAGGSSGRTSRLSPSPLGRFAKDSIRSTNARSVSPIPSRLGGNGPAYLRTLSPAGSPGMSGGHSTNSTIVAGGARSESPGRPRWLRKKTSSSSLVDSCSTGKSTLGNSTNPSMASGARPIRTIVVDGSEDSEGYEDCSEGSGTTTPVYGGVGSVSPLGGGGAKGMLVGEGLRMSELVGKVGQLPGRKEGEKQPLPLISVEAQARHVQACLRSFD